MTLFFHIKQNKLLSLIIDSVVYYPIQSYCIKEKSKHTHYSNPPNHIMKQKLKMTGLFIAGVIFGAGTMVSAILSILGYESGYMRIITPFSSFISFLFLGLFAILDLKNKSLGYIFLAVSVLSFIAAISSYLFLVRNGVF